MDSPPIIYVCGSYHSKYMVLLLLLAAAVLPRRGGAAAAPSTGTTYRAHARAPAFEWTGRWEDVATARGGRRGDWPCVSVRFGADGGGGGNDGNLTGGNLTLAWSAVRTRLLVTVTDDATGATAAEDILKAPGLSLGPAPLLYHTLEGLPAHATVTLTKLTQAAPLSMGVGRLLRPSVLTIVSVTSATHTLRAPAPATSAPTPNRAIDLYGASDTAGYCVDGNPSMGAFDYEVEGWKYSNCHNASGSDLGRALGARVTLQGYAGVGLTQNADAAAPWMMGKLTMDNLWNYTLQTETTPRFWNLAEQHRRDNASRAVVVSLGGNDYNHQENRTPSNATFTGAYVQFLEKLHQAYGYGAVGAGDDDEEEEDKEENVWPPPPKFISVCGQGSPQEAKEDPDNNRCRPCPHVADATRAFNTKHAGQWQASYVFVPCDGSVITGHGDIGCNGHKNARGQKEVATFLHPKIAEIMGWH